jgi:uncharacterized protein DUF3987
MKELFHETEVRKASALLIEPGAVFEVRALDAKLGSNYRIGTVAGYFDSADDCVTELKKLSAAMGIYITLNPVNSALLARCANRLDYAPKDTATSDQYILRRVRLLIDVDPVRPSGISASKSEKAAARKKAVEIRDYLRARGWPEPLIADSGNGYHLVYLIDLPCEDDGLVEKVLNALADRFDGDGVRIDRAVHNPARIVRLYGTLAAKGDNTQERPHRFSEILKAPEAFEAVTAEQLLALVDQLQPEDPAPVEVSPAPTGTFDVEGFLTRYGVEVSERTTEPDDSIKWTLSHCPFNPDHVKDVAVYQYPDGKLGFHCFKSSCAGKHWRDFRRYFEPERKSLALRVEADAEPVELPPPPAPYVPPPLELLPSHLQKYIHAAAESLNVDVAFILLPLLSSLGAAIGNSRSILLKHGFVQPPVIWTAIIGRSGSRKSPSIDKACFAVMEHEYVLTRQNKEAKEIYEDELAVWERKLRKDREKKPEPPRRLTCVLDDLTMEVLPDRLMANPRGVLICKDELSHLFGSFDQYKSHAKGSDVSRWLSLHTGAFLGIDRRSDNRQDRIWRPRVPIAGGIQPKVLRRALTEDFFDRGLPARFLFAYPPFRKDKWSEATIPEKLESAVLELFETLWLLQPEEHNGEFRPQLLPLDEDAKAEFIRYYNDCGEAAVYADEHEEAAWGKLSGYAARLALVGQLARDPNAKTITEEVMKAACDLARWSGRETIRIYAILAETREQQEARELDEFIKRRGWIVTVRDVMQNYAPLKNQKKKVEAALNARVAAGRGTWEPIGTTEKGGRPTCVFRLLRPSTSTQPYELRGKTGGSVDVDSSNPREITPSAESNKEAKMEAVVGDETGIGKL